MEDHFRCEPYKESRAFFIGIIMPVLSRMPQVKHLIFVVTIRAYQIPAALIRHYMTQYLPPGNG